MTNSRDGAGLPVALLVSVLLLIGVTGVGIAAAPEVVTSAASPAAASDPAVDSESARPGSNLSYLLEALGEGFRGDPTVLKVVPGSPTATGLPAGFEGVGQATLQTTTGTLSEQCPLIDSGSPDTCEVRTVADAEVAVQVHYLQELDSDQGFATIAIYFLRPDGDLVQTSVTAIGEVTASDDVEALSEQIADWLAQFEDPLIEAATDPRMHR